MHRKRPTNPRPHALFRRCPLSAETGAAFPGNGFFRRMWKRTAVLLFLVLATIAPLPAAGETASTDTELPPLPEALATSTPVSADQPPFSLSEPRQEHVGSLLSPDTSETEEETDASISEDSHPELPPLPEQIALPSETAPSGEPPVSSEGKSPALSLDVSPKMEMELPPLPESEASPTTSPTMDETESSSPAKDRKPASGDAEQGVLILPPLPPLPETQGNPFGVPLPPVPTTAPEEFRPELSEQIPLPPLSPFEGTWAVLMKADTSYGKASDVFRLLTLRLEEGRFLVLTGGGASFSMKPTGAERLEGMLSTTRGENVTIRMDLPRGRQDLTISLLRSGKVVVTLFALPEDMGSRPIPGENATLQTARERFRTAFESYLAILEGNAPGDAEKARKKAVMDYLNFQDLATRR